MGKFALILLAVLMSSCGYHYGQGSQISCYKTVSVPFVKGDWDGSLTSAIVKEISQSGSLSYEHDGGSLILLVTLADLDDENIGYRYDRSKTGEVKKAIIPEETRITATAEVTLIERSTGRTVLGPVLLSAYAEFDHDYYTVRDRVNVFSLGQLTDYDEAQDAAMRPLYDRLAGKIVNYINNSW